MTARENSYVNINDGNTTQSVFLFVRANDLRHLLRDCLPEFGLMIVTGSYGILVFVS